MTPRNLRVNHPHMTTATTTTITQIPPPDISDSGFYVYGRYLHETKPKKKKRQKTKTHARRTNTATTTTAVPLTVLNRRRMV